MGRVLAKPPSGGETAPPVLAPPEAGNPPELVAPPVVAAPPVPFTPPDATVPPEASPPPEAPTPPEAETPPAEATNPPVLPLGDGAASSVQATQVAATTHRMYDSSEDRMWGARNDPTA
jgi:hypothetical protein